MPLIYEMAAHDDNEIMNNANDDKMGTYGYQTTHRIYGYGSILGH